MKWYIIFAVALLGVVVSCKRMPLETSHEFIRDYKGLDDLHFYTVPTGDQVVCTFLDGNSFASYVDVKTNVLENGSMQRLEISFTMQMGYVRSSKFERIDRSAFATVIHLQHFDVRKWEVVYKDEGGIHAINYGGILREPLKEYVPKPSEGPVTNL